MPKVRSKAQAGFYGAIIAGKARDGGGLTPEKAKEMLRGTSTKGLPWKVKKRKKGK